MKKVTTMSQQIYQCDNAELALCRQNGEFYKAYLNVLLECEKTKYDALQERIAALHSAPPQVMETFEALDTLK